MKRKRVEAENGLKPFLGKEHHGLSCDSMAGRLGQWELRGGTPGTFMLHIEGIVLSDNLSLRLAF